MRLLTLSGLLVLSAGSTFAAGSPGQGMRGWGYRSDYNRLYNPSTERTISGVIRRMVSTQPPLRSMSPVTTVYLAQPSGQMVTAHLGPTWFVSHLSPTVAVGDQVQITGSSVKTSNSSFVLARKVILGNRVLYLREVTGFPMWVAARPFPEINSQTSNHPPYPVYTSANSSAGPIAVAKPIPEELVPNSQAQNLSGSIQRTYTEVNPQTGQTDTYLTLKTDQGDVTVDLGPQWYIQQQPMNFAQGGNAYVQGVPWMPPMGVTQIPGSPIYVATGISYGNQLMVLQSPFGFPLWSPWGNWN